jgi:exosome complex RNA-binding protein Csl4
MSIPLFVEAEDLITKEEVVDKEEVVATQAAVILLKNGKIYRQRNAPEYIARERTEKTNRTPVVAPAVVMVVVVIKTHEAVVEVDIIIMNTNTGLLQPEVVEPQGTFQKYLPKISAKPIIELMMSQKSQGQPMR